MVSILVVSIILVVSTIGESIVFESDTVAFSELLQPTATAEIIVARSAKLKICFFISFVFKLNINVNLDNQITTSLFISISLREIDINFEATSVVEKLPLL
ncbi:hypothetical protein [Mucilaginibacter antarcticus]|uniref:hypothetical protein n=1 Tax=Mucilaginibacter antarcticus TaxID=1855725 RepID=UPI00363565C9